MRRWGEIKHDPAVKEHALTAPGGFNGLQLLTALVWVALAVLLLRKNSVPVLGPLLAFAKIMFSPRHYQRMQETADGLDRFNAWQYRGGALRRWHRLEQRAASHDWVCRSCFRHLAAAPPAQP